MKNYTRLDEIVIFYTGGDCSDSTTLYFLAAYYASEIGNMTNDEIAAMLRKGVPAIDKEWAEEFLTERESQIEGFWSHMQVKVAEYFDRKPLALVEVSVHDYTGKFTGFDLPNFNYRPTYGSCGYLSHFDDETECDFCTNKSRDWYWTIEDTGDNTSALHVFKGNVAEIQELVRDEIQHFDTVVVYGDVSTD